MTNPAPISLDSSELKQRIVRFQQAESRNRPADPARHRRSGRSARTGADRVVRRRPLPDHRPARHGEDLAGANDRGHAGSGLQPHPVHSGPDAVRHHRHGHHRRRSGTGRRVWTFVKGPIFGNIMLADEINRTPPKTQSALLEAMQERSCTVRGNHHTVAGAVLRARHAEPDRARRHVSAARSATRPFHLQHGSRLPDRRKTK